MLFFFFFFKQKTAYEMRISDWSSDVCSSDLRAGADEGAVAEGAGYGRDALEGPGRVERHLDQGESFLDQGSSHVESIPGLEAAQDGHERQAGEAGVQRRVGLCRHGSSPGRHMPASVAMRVRPATVAAAASTISERTPKWSSAVR